jgi:hypothetical protein
MDIWASWSIGSIITTVIAMFMQLTVGVIGRWELSTIIAVTFIYNIIFILSSRRGQD